MQAILKIVAVSGKVNPGRIASYALMAEVAFGQIRFVRLLGAKGQKKCKGRVYWEERSPSGGLGLTPL
ncbi:hypothetical protein HDF10_000298 [Edaphobacter lichenicola]|uniref:Uncharacterized protein n=1 Tax=Tunturiibacter lichenicola TaxID=2051959 RepID=A0A7W8N2F9_9BACT|nr:hypothetical protein [Edaphobacter lichenicola]